MMTTVVSLGEEHVPEITRVLCEAFYDYPLMRFVVGEGQGEYGRRLEALNHFFVMARVLRGEPLIGIMNGSDLTATALVSYPGPREIPPELAELRDELWHDLGDGSRSRYQDFGVATATFDIDAPHIHLDMIGVSEASQGSGLSRILIEHVHCMSREDDGSQGVTLTTEDPANVSLYEHFGYRVVGHSRVSPALETWGFFRPD